METILYARIKSLCEEKGITITKLESDLGFGNSSIKKWNGKVCPSADKLLKVAKYFNVSVDYLLGNVNIKTPISEILEDEDIISFQRAREKMSDKDKEKSMQMLKLGFEYAFDDTDQDED